MQSKYSRHRINLTVAIISAIIFALIMYLSNTSAEANYERENETIEYMKDEKIEYEYIYNTSYSHEPEDEICEIWEIRIPKIELIAPIYRRYNSRNIRQICRPLRRNE